MFVEEQLLGVCPEVNCALACSYYYLLLFSQGKHPDVLLLDLRDEDAYNQAHILNAVNYPARMLTHSTNCFDATMLAFVNRHPKRIIVVYDVDERIAVPAAKQFYEKGVDNVHILTGVHPAPTTHTRMHGRRHTYLIWPNGLEREAVNWMLATSPTWCWQALSQRLDVQPCVPCPHTFVNFMSHCRQISMQMMKGMSA
jgi:rhodanese-related sulfurtransferase